MFPLFFSAIMMYSIKDKILKGLHPSEDQVQEEKTWLSKPVAKGIALVFIGVGALWAAKFLFSAVGGSVRAYKEMVRSFRE